MMKVSIFLIIILTSIRCKDLDTERGSVKIGGLNLYYESRGKGPAVILLHAGLQDHTMWNMQVDALASDHRVVTLDLPAHGQSSGKDTVMLFADVLSVFMDRLQIRRACFIGLSYGSECAINMTLDHPERVEKLVLISSGLTGWDKVITTDSVSQRCFASLDSAFSGKNDTMKAQIFTAVWCDGPFRKPDEVSDEARNYVLKTTLLNLTNHPDDSWAVLNKTPSAERVSEIKKPTLIIFGKQDVPVVISASHFLHQSIAGSREIGISNAAHMLNLEAHDEFNRTVGDFLSQP